MEFLRKQILQTRTYLKGLTLSQRLAVGSCAALIVVSLLWLVQWGSKPELVPLLDQPITAADLAPIENRLNTLGVEYKIVDDVVKVPPEQRSRLLAQLSESQALPKDISIGFDKLIGESNAFVGADEQNRRWTVALQNELAKVLRHFDGVQDAQVFIAGNTRRSVTGPSVTPTASVVVTLKPGLTLDKPRTYAYASFVSRAFGGLDVTKVAVTDARTNLSKNVPGPGEEMDAGNDLATRKMTEDYFASQICGVLGIRNALVYVHAELDTSLRKETNQTWTKPITLTDKTKSMTQQRGTPAGGPGVVPNTSTKALGTGAVADRSEETVNEATYDTKPQKVETIESARNGIKSLRASVNVPRSYLALIYKTANPGKEPNGADLKSLEEEEKKRIAGLVRTALAAKDDSDAVTVDWYYDMALADAGPGVAEAATGGGGDIMTMMRLYGGKAGLAGLAALSLLMMLMMVRKVGEGPVLPGEESPKQQVIHIIGKKQPAQEEAEEMEEVPEMLTVNEPPVGEAEAHEDLLVGREVDESTLRVHQVVQQVSNLVKEDPKTSAGILERWIQAEEK